jgi:hypothetical protein
LRWRQLNLNWDHILIGDLLKQVRDAIEPRALLIVGVHNVPRGVLGIRMGKHHVLRPGIVDPMSPGFVDRIAHALLEAFLLLLVVQREPILDKSDA